jgi:hypothetical protein
MNLPVGLTSIVKNRLLLISIITTYTAMVIIWPHIGIPL